MSSFLLLQQCPTCLDHPVWMVLEMGGRWPFSCSFQDLFNIARSIFVQLPLSLFFLRFVSVRCLEKSAFYFIGRSSCYITDNLLIALHAFPSRVLMSFSVGETLLPR